MRARLVLMAAAIGAPVACSSSPSSGEPVAIVPNIVVPEDLIGQISTFSLQVFSTTGGIGCDTTTGDVTGNVSGATPVASTGAISSMCPAGVLRCAKLSIPFQTGTSIFSVTGFGADGKTPVANGCAEATINQSSLDVNIKLVRVLPKAMCPDGTVEPTETCDDSTKVCVSCQTVEELLSLGNAMNAGTSTGSAGQKTNPFLLWNPSTGNTSNDAAGALVALFTDAASSPGSLQIGTRLMDDTLSPPTLFGGAVDGSSILLPNCASGCSTLPPPAAAFDEKEPSAASLSGKAYVVFSSDLSPGTGDPFDIYYAGFAQSASLTALSNCPVNSKNGSTNTSPSVAASGNALFVAWQDQNGNVSGRMVTPGSGCGTLGTQANSFGSGVGSSTTGAKVAAAGGGWAVVWPQGSSIELQIIGSNGQPSGSPKTVGSGANPSVAWDGSELAVAWAGSKGIQVQRYMPDGTVASNAAKDATATVNTTSGLGSTPSPAIAGGSTTGGNGFFAVSWISANGVQARLINGGSGALTDNSGYLFNTTDGTATDFQVNVNANRNPANPTVAIGGNPGFIAFGWEDHGSTCPTSATFPGTPCFGVVARRFPLPTN